MIRLSCKQCDIPFGDHLVRDWIGHNALDVGDALDEDEVVIDVLGAASATPGLTVSLDLGGVHLSLGRGIAEGGTVPIAEYLVIAPAPMLRRMGTLLGDTFHLAAEQMERSGIDGA